MSADRRGSQDRRDRPGRGEGADRLTEVLDAAFACLARYGARRTTMDDIAAEVGVSRSALYQYVRNKDDAFRQLAERLHGRASERARRAARARGGAADRVAGVLGAKLDLALELRGHSPHTVELMDEHARVFGDVCARFTGDIRELLVAIFTEAGTAGGVTPEDAADSCLALAVGLERHSAAQRLIGPAARVLAEGLAAQGGQGR
ncbi:TetR/AcrR family transcriptional regulator [Nocardiopsis halophila]|uniref:TetR/AcrR family transcriptional regulator n=1 Tax=Nocardiopsis halophila TaxID=141692 RepID=UPI000344FD54|nr:TetR/AcrR family transcriptional regulator [Nocardiopsis halophila]